MFAISDSIPSCKLTFVKHAHTKRKTLKMYNKKGPIVYRSNLTQLVLCFQVHSFIGGGGAQALFPMTIFSKSVKSELRKICLFSLRLKM